MPPPARRSGNMREFKVAPMELVDLVGSSVAKYASHSSRHAIYPSYFAWPLLFYFLFPRCQHEKSAHKCLLPRPPLGPTRAASSTAPFSPPSQTTSAATTRRRLWPSPSLVVEVPDSPP